MVLERPAVVLSEARITLPTMRIGEHAGGDEEAAEDVDCGQHQRKEAEDHFDVGTDFTPFRLSV